MSERRTTADMMERYGPVATDNWRCRRCGSTRWVAASLNGGLTRIRQCVPCGRYSGDLVEPAALTKPTDTALGRCQVLLQCHRETGHELLGTDHEAREAAK
jgi:hypothetical protein